MIANEKRRKKGDLLFKEKPFDPGRRSVLKEEGIGKRGGRQRGLFVFEGRGRVRKTKRRTR